jgi:hypothetical protein
MPQIQLSRAERSSLRKIFDRPRLAGEIPADHEEKFINYDLARKRVLLIYITPLGQIELLRQGFGGARRSAVPQYGRLAREPSLPLLTGRREPV